jgi:hypothetical protein
MNKAKTAQPPAPTTARHPCATPGCSALIAHDCIVCVAHTAYPQRRLGNCPHCACTVLADAWLWSTSTGWQPVGPVVSPVFGDVHDCATARIQYAAR